MSTVERAAEEASGPSLVGPAVTVRALAPAPADGMIDPLRLIAVGLRHWRLLTVMAVLAVPAGIGVTFLQAPRYEARALLEIRIPPARVFEEFELVSESGDVRAFLTAREKLMSRSLAGRVVAELGLGEDAGFLAPPAGLDSLGLFRNAEAVETLPAPERERRATDRVLEDLSVELVNSTSLLSVAYRDGDPERAARIANSVVANFIALRLDQASETSAHARTFIGAQAREARERLHASEQALVDYAKAARLTVDAQSPPLILDSLRSANEALGAAVQRRMETGRLVNQIDEGLASSLPQVLENQSIREIRDRIADLSAQYQLKLKTFKPDFPEMVQLDAQIRELRRQVDEIIAGIVRSIRLQHEDAREGEEDLKRRLAALELEQAAFRDKSIDYTILERQVASDRAQYDLLVAKLNEVGVGAELAPRSAVLVDAAAVPLEPYSPRPLVNLAVSLSLFAALAAAIVSVRELSDRTFPRAEEAEAALGLPVLAVLPAVRRGAVMRELEDPRSPLAEAYRSLRAALQVAGVGGPIRTLLVTSAAPGEGRSTASLRLGQDFAALGLSVLVLDADLRAPNLHRLAGSDGAVGLSEILGGLVPPGALASVVQEVRDGPADSLRLIAAGTPPANPADLLASSRTAHLIGALAERFDLVVIDSPPVGALSDAPMLTRLADATLLIVEAGRTPRDVVGAALQRLRLAGGQVVGAALVNARSEPRRRGKVEARREEVAPDPWVDEAASKRPVSAAEGARRIRVLTFDRSPPS